MKKESVSSDLCYFGRKKPILLCALTPSIVVRGAKFLFPGTFCPVVATVPADRWYLSSIHI
jgi:hypothetical protein